MADEQPTIYARLREVQHELKYSPETGLFEWDKKTLAYRRYGKFAGSLHKNGYTYIGVGGHKYTAHRLAWYFMTGEYPNVKLDIDHKNGNRSDNRWDNLRLCKRHQNLANSDVHRSVYGRGVQRNGKSGYMARIKFNKKVVYIGTYPTPEAAKEAYIARRTQLLDGFEVKV